MRSFDSPGLFKFSLYVQGHFGALQYLFHGEQFGFSKFNANHFIHGERFAVFTGQAKPLNQRRQQDLAATSDNNFVIPVMEFNSIAHNKRAESVFSLKSESSNCIIRICKINFFDFSGHAINHMEQFDIFIVNLHIFRILDAFQQIDRFGQADGDDISTIFSQSNAFRRGDFQFFIVRNGIQFIASFISFSRFSRSVRLHQAKLCHSFRNAGFPYYDIIRVQFFRLDNRSRVRQLDFYRFLMTILGNQDHRSRFKISFRSDPNILKDIVMTIIAEIICQFSDLKSFFIRHGDVILILRQLRLSRRYQIRCFYRIINAFENIDILFWLCSYFFRLRIGQTDRQHDIVSSRYRHHSALKVCTR